MVLGTLLRMRGGGGAVAWPAARRLRGCLVIKAAVVGQGLDVGLGWDCLGLRTSGHWQHALAALCRSLVLFAGKAGGRRA